MLNLCFENIQLNFPHYFIRLKTNFHHNIVVIWLLVNCRERERRVWNNFQDLQEARRAVREGGREWWTSVNSNWWGGGGGQSVSPASLLPPPAVAIQPSSLTPVLAAVLPVVLELQSRKEMFQPRIPPGSLTDWINTEWSCRFYIWNSATLNS